jgi:hypothetical protein
MDSIEIQLRSVTIFWEELGSSKGERNLTVLADWWERDVQPWLDVAIKHDYNPHTSGVWFSNGHDAILFKLKFMGQMPN